MILSGSSIKENIIILQESISYEPVLVVCVENSKVAGVIVVSEPVTWDLESFLVNLIGLLHSMVCQLEVEIELFVLNLIARLAELAESVYGVSANDIVTPEQSGLGGKLSVVTIWNVDVWELWVDIERPRLSLWD